MSERTALLLSPLFSLVIAVVAISVWWQSDSQAILLDGLFNLLFVFMGLLTLKVQTLVAKKSSSSFQFGYSSFEPLLNTVKGLLIASLSLVALAPAVQSLFGGGRLVEPGYGVIYGSFACVAGLIVAAVQHQAAKRWKSPLLEADVANWIVNGSVSAAVGLAFAAVGLISNSPYAGLANYADPVLVTLVILVTLPVPIRLIRKGTSQLLLMAPEEGTRIELEALVKDKLGDAGFQKVVTKMAKSGRFVFISIYALMNNPNDSLSAGKLDELRGRLQQQLAHSHPGVVVDLTLTASSTWLEEL